MIFVLKFQVNELEQKIQYIEQVANETAEKYQELATHQQSRQQIDDLKEKNKILKNVRRYFFIIGREHKRIIFN